MAREMCVCVTSAAGAGRDGPTVVGGVTVGLLSNLHLEGFALSDT